MSQKSLALSEVRKHLPRIIDRVEGGEHIQITRHGKVVAVLSAPKNKLSQKKLRGMKIQIARDFDEPIDAAWDALK